MALYRLEAKIINRQNCNRSVIPSAAYRAGNTLHKAAYRSGNTLVDDRIEATFNYRSRAQEVLHSEIMAPEGGPIWLKSHGEGKTDYTRQRAMRERLWNTIEQVEKRKDSQLAREFIAALPRELNLEQQVELVRGWCEKEFLSKRFVVDFSIHKSKDGKNPHTHILVTTRPVEGQGFGKKPSMAGKFNGRGAVGIGAKAMLDAWRETWETHANAALEKAGREERVDRRSLKDRGIDRIPEPKIGVAATAMKRRGIIDPERFKLVRFVKALNELKPISRAMQRFGELQQTGVGKTWWERSIIFMSNARTAARETVMDTWRIMLESRQPQGHDHGVLPQKGPDLSR